MYDLHDCGTESKSVVQRYIGRSINFHVRCPQFEACQLVIYDGRIWHDFWPNHIFMEKRAAFICVLCDGPAKMVLEEDIFHEVIFPAIQTIHSEKVRYGRSASRYKCAEDSGSRCPPLCRERLLKVVDEQIATRVNETT